MFLRINNVKEITGDTKKKNIDLVDSNAADWIPFNEVKINLVAK